MIPLDNMTLTVSCAFQSIENFYENKMDKCVNETLFKTLFYFSTLQNSCTRQDIFSNIAHFP